MEDLPRIDSPAAAQPLEDQRDSTCEAKTKRLATTVITVGAAKLTSVGRPADCRDYDCDYYASVPAFCTSLSTQTTTLAPAASTAIPPPPPPTIYYHHHNHHYFYFYLYCYHYHTTNSRTPHAWYLLLLHNFNLVHQVTGVALA